MVIWGVGGQVGSKNHVLDFCCLSCHGGFNLCLLYLEKIPILTNLVNLWVETINLYICSVPAAVLNITALIIIPFVLPPVALRTLVAVRCLFD